MVACVLTGDDGRVAATAVGGYLTGGKMMDIPEEIDLSALHHYRIVNGEFVYDPALEDAYRLVE